MSGPLLVEEIFTVKDKDVGGKRFPNVSRVVCVGENYDLQLRLDYASHIYNLDPQPPSNKFTFALAAQLRLPGLPCIL